MHRYNDNPNIRAIKLWYSFCPSYFLLMILNAVFSNFSPYFNIYMSAEIVSEIAGGRNREKLIVLVMITIIGNFLITILGGFLGYKFGHKSTIFLQREDIYFNNKMLSLDYENLENTEVRQLRRKIIESAKIDCHGKQSLINNINALVNSVIDITFAIYLFAEMFILIAKKEFGWVLFAFVGILFMLIALNIFIAFFVKKKMSNLSNKVSNIMIEENRIDDAIECYNMGKDVRLYRQDKLIMKIKNYAFMLHKKAFKTMFSERFKSDILILVLSNLLKIVTYVFICIYALKNVFGIGSIIKYIGFIQRMIHSIIYMFNTFGEIKYNTPFIKDYLSFFDIQNKMSHGSILVNKQILFEGNNNIEFEFCNVSFKYPGTDNYALQNVSIKIKAGERLAIVGMNGSGKTTFIKLLCRLYDPTEGIILLNGVDIRKYNYDQYLALFSVVFQDFKLFSFTLGQNVAAKSNYDSKRVMECLKKAGLGERFDDSDNDPGIYLYKDFDENGVEISGGEAQKIALARAIYRNSPIIILDEPTAALDPIAEYEIYSKFDEIVEKKTAFYISHRLSSCRFCDDIIVFHKGSLVQRGTHDKLVNDRKGKYYELWNAQAQYYV